MKLATKAEKEAAEKAARAANQKLSAIRDAERLHENNGLKGKHFKFRNCYSCPEKPSDYWNLYSKVQKVSQDGMITTFEFQTDRYGQVTIKTNDYVYQMNDHTEISVAEFNSAWRTLQKKIAATKP